MSFLKLKIIHVMSKSSHYFWLSTFIFPFYLKKNPFNNYFWTHFLMFPINCQLIFLQLLFLINPNLDLNLSFKHREETSGSHHCWKQLLLKKKTTKNLFQNNIIPCYNELKPNRCFRCAADSTRAGSDYDMACPRYTLFPGPVSRWAPPPVSTSYICRMLWSWPASQACGNKTQMQVYIVWI